MPRVAVEAAKRDIFFQGTPAQRAYILSILIGGSGMPAGRPTDESEVQIVIDFDQSPSVNKQNARSAIIQNVRAQGITISDNAAITTLFEFLQSL